MNGAKEKETDKLLHRRLESGKPEADQYQAETSEQENFWNVFEDEFRVLAEESTDMIFVYKNDRVVYVNENFVKATEYEKEEFYSLNFDFLSLTAPESTELIKANFTNQLKGKDVPPYECSFITKGGRRIEVRITTKSINFYGEKAVLGIVTDISIPQHAEKKMRESEKLYQTLFEQSPDAIMIIDPETTMPLEFNEKMPDMLGYSREEFRKLQICDYEATESCEEIKARIKKILCKGSDRFETKLRTKTGKIKNVLVSVRVIEYAGKRVFHNILTDITKRKQAEEALSKSEEEFRLLFETAIDSIFWADAKTGLIIRCNKAAEALLEKDRREIIGYHQKTIHPPQKYEYYYRMFKEHIARHGVVNEEAEVITKSGKIKPVHITAVTTSIGERQIIQGIFRDISKQKRAEEEIRKAYENWEATFNAIHSMILIRDKNFNVVKVNKFFANMIKKKAEELIGKKCYEVFHGTNEPWPDCPYRRTLVAGAPVTDEYYEPNLGIYLRVSASPIYGDKGEITGFVHIADDITERKKSEKALKKARDELKSKVKERTVELKLTIDLLKDEIANHRKSEERLEKYSRELSIKNRIADIFLTRPDNEAYVEVLQVILEIMKSPDGLFGYVTHDENVICTALSMDVGTNRKIFCKTLVLPRDKWESILGAAMSEKKIICPNKHIHVSEEHIFISRALNVPIIYKGEVIGNLLIANKKVNYDEEDKKLLKTISDYIATILSSRLQRDQRESERNKVKEQLEASLKEKDILLKEINYRVRNNLQIIHSLYNLQKEYISDKNAKEHLRESQRRIRAISLVHEKLYNSENVAKINFKEYINDLINNLFRFYEINSDNNIIIIEADDIFLNINYTIPCGMIISELVASFLQYGFLGSSSKGKITIAIHQINEEEIEIIFNDNGINISSDLNITDAESLSMQIITTLVGQLKGTIVTKRNDGNEFSIRFKIKR
jgi:PAS domain S-box-containing protein